MNVLVDTSIWSLALRRRRKRLNKSEQKLVQELKDLIHDGRVMLPGVIRQEVLSGIRNKKSFEQLRRYLRHFDDHPLTTDDYEEAARISNECRSRGISGSAIDFLLCAVAVRNALALFTTDTDFERYADIVPLQLHAANQTG